MFTRLFTPRFKSEARTLRPEEVTETEFWNRGLQSRTHADGWTIEGVIKEDYYYWVNEFVAEHPLYGIVRGDFEKEVQASSEEAFIHFTERHHILIWDYHDI